MRRFAPFLLALALVLGIAPGLAFASSTPTNVGTEGELTSALAMVGEYAVCKELFSLFTHLDKPPFPCRYFDHADPALKWLRTFL